MPWESLAKWGAIAIVALVTIFGMVKLGRSRSEKIGRQQAEGEVYEDQAAAEARRAAARRKRWTRERLQRWAERRSRPD